MNGFDISGLSPEELQQLTIHCIQSNDQLVQVVQMLMEKVSEHDEHINKLDDVVMNEIIGGVDQLYQKNMHDTGLEGIKSQYGSMFDPHMDTLKEIYPDVDLYEELLKEKQGYGDDEEGFGNRVSSIGDALKTKMDRIRGIPPEVAASPDIANSSEAPAGEISNDAQSQLVDAEDPVVATIKKMKSRKNPLSMG